jgi:hypothetical protein
MRDTKKIEELIRALIAKAKGTDNEAEAAIFMAKAHELLEKHQLDLGATLNADDPVEAFEGLDQAASSHKWNRELYRALGTLYGCKSIRRSYWGTSKKTGFAEERFQQRLVGRASAIMTTQIMYPWVCEQVRKEATEISKRTGMSAQGQAKRVGAALVSRIWTMVREARAGEQGPRTEAAKNALATIDLVEAEFKRLYPEAQTGVARRTVSDALSREAAGKIGLHQQAGHSSALRLGSQW